MMAKVQQDLVGGRRRPRARPGRVRRSGSSRSTGDGIPVTAVYFAPDHTDSSQYVQYFGMIDGVVVAGPVGHRAPNADRAADLFAEALAATGDAQDRALQRSSARR